MAYQFQTAGAATIATIASGGGTISPPAPSGVTAGDLIVLGISTRGTPTSITTPTGFEYLGGASRVRFFARIATGSGDTPSITVTPGTEMHCMAQYARFTGSYATIGAAGADILDQAVVYFGATATVISTPALGSTPSVDGCLILYLGHHFDDIGPAVSQPNSSTLIGEIDDASRSVWWAFSYDIQTTAASVGASSFVGEQSGSSTTSNAAVVALLPAAGTKYVKLLADSSAASATGVEVVVYSAPAGSNYITGTTRYGSVNAQEFEASLESGSAVLKVLASDVGCDGLAAATTVAALARNTTYTTGMVSATIIEE